MPVTIIVRRGTPLPYIDGVGTQTVAGTLTLGNPTVVEFDPTVFTAPGVYTIFTYSGLVGSVDYLQADADALAACGFSACVFSDTGASITARLTT